MPTFPSWRDFEENREPEKIGTFSMKVPLFTTIGARCTARDAGPESGRHRSNPSIWWDRSGLFSPGKIGEQRARRQFHAAARVVLVESMHVSHESFCSKQSSHHGESHNLDNTKSELVAEMLSLLVEVKDPSQRVHMSLLNVPLMYLDVLWV